jgi:hypothetical protein
LLFKPARPKQDARPVDGPVLPVSSPVLPVSGPVPPVSGPVTGLFSARAFSFATSMAFANSAQIGAL